MKSDIPDKVAETLKDIGMTSKEAGWNCHGTYVLLHKALEKVAVHKKISFKEPTVLECNSEKGGQFVGYRNYGRQIRMVYRRGIPIKQ